MSNSITLSKKQVETLKDFFSWEYIEILYGGGARWWKSWLLWVLMAIWVASMPWSSWLISRTKLSELQATTMATFYQVLKELGFWPKSFRDRVREKKHLEFNNGSKVFVIQVDYEPSDPEFDRLGSYSYTGAFLDEGQQMVVKVRSVLAWRFSETSNYFQFEVDKPKKGEIDLENMGYSLKINVVGEAVYDPRDIETPKEQIKEVIQQGKHHCVIIDYYDLFIPYSITKVEDKGDKLLLTAVWKFTPCTLISCNPWKNFTYTDFYKPYMKGIAENDPYKYLTWKTNDGTTIKRKFTQALVTDNPFVEKSYVHGLEISDDKITKQRLLYGNFEYDDDPRLLYDKNLIESIFWELLLNDTTTHITVDAARAWKDHTVIMVWKWLDVVEVVVIKEDNLVNQAQKIADLGNFYNTSINNIIIDEVWVGWGLVDMLWCKGFIANASPMHPYASKYLAFKKRNYANLRTQAFFYLKQYMLEWKIRVKCERQIRELLTEELWFVRQVNIDGDGKIQLESKSVMKDFLGRSPDYCDCLSFRMWWIIKNHHEWQEDMSDDIEMTEEDYLDEIFGENEEEHIDIDIDVY